MLFGRRRGDFRDLMSPNRYLATASRFLFGRHKSIIADFDEAFWQHMLQEAVDKIKSRQGGCFPLIGVLFLNRKVT
jgi:hypothetical protein